MTTVNDVLDFWFPPDTRPDAAYPGGRRNPAWFKVDPAFDRAIRRQFMAAHEQAARGSLDSFSFKLKRIRSF